MRKIQTFALVLACLFGTSVHAMDGNSRGWEPCPDPLIEPGSDKADLNWDLTLSPYTHHWSKSSEHKQVNLIALDRRSDNNGFCGLALFSNSFGQPSAYLYMGKRWDGLLGHPKLFTKISFGLIYGYRGAYKNKIPANQLGIAPAILPSLGYEFTPRDSAQMYVLGTAGLLFAYVRRF
jgi:hypothetical protein